MDTPEILEEQKVLTFEEAIRKMTSFPAQRFNLKDRGLIKEGMWADIVVFDMDSVSDKGTWENPRQYPSGIEYFIVNGVVTVDRGEHTGKLAGKVLRHGWQEG